MTENDLRARVCAQARLWLGRKEADGSHREIIDVYNQTVSLPALPAGYCYVPLPSQELAAIADRATRACLSSSSIRACARCYLLWFVIKMQSLRPMSTVTEVLAMSYRKVTYAEQVWYLVKYKLKEVCTISQALIFLFGAFFGAFLYSVFVDRP